jgi:hypothetical protein
MSKINRRSSTVMIATNLLVCRVDRAEGLAGHRVDELAVDEELGGAANHVGDATRPAPVDM